MVLVHQLPGLEIVVKISGKAAEEYDAEEGVVLDEDNDRRTTRYIQAKDNAEFEIVVRVAPDVDFKGDAIMVCVYLDGQLGGGRFCKATDPGGEESLRIRGVRARGQLYPFRFSPITLTEQSVRQQGRQRIKDLGLLRILVQHIKLGPITGSSATSKAKVVEARKEIPEEKETALKSLSHAAGHGAPRSDTDRDLRSFEVVGGQKNYAAEIFFLYRGLEDLKRLGVIPRSPSPVPSEDIAHESMTPSQGRKDNAQLRVGLQIAQCSVHTANVTQVEKATQNARNDERVAPKRKREEETEESKAQKKARRDGVKDCTQYMSFLFDGDDELGVAATAALEVRPKKKAKVVELD